MADNPTTAALNNTPGAEITQNLVSNVIKTSGWFTPATQKEFADSKLGAFSLFTDTRNLFKAPVNVMWPPLLTGMIITLLISILGIGAILGCWIGDLVFPRTNPGAFTVETLVMAFGSAAIVFIFNWSRNNGKNKPPIHETITEFGLLVAKFGVLHLFFQFTGFYSWAFPDSALGGCLTTQWTEHGSDKVKAEIAAGVDTGARSVYDEHYKESHKESPKAEAFSNIARKIPISGVL